MLVVASLEHSVSYTTMMKRVSLLLCILITAENDMCDVLEVIHDLNDWKELGLQLGLLFSSLERIDREKRGAISSCKMDMLSAWLRQQDDVSQRGVPSWSMLRAALLRMGEYEMASRIVSGYNYSIHVI